MPKVYQRAAARRDLVEHFVYLAENAGLETAERFLTNAEASFDDLSGQPLMGAPLTLQNPALTGIRKWRVNAFGSHLIFYLPRLEGVSIVRLLHGARDWWSLLEIKAWSVGKKVKRESAAIAFPSRSTAVRVAWNCDARRRTCSNGVPPGEAR